MTTALPRPGWYPEPGRPGALRWFDGERWTEMRQADPRVPPAPQIIVQAPQKRRVNHALHLLLSILTFGLWLPVWLILAIAA